MFAPISTTLPSENSTLYTLMSKTGFLSAFPMGCPSKSLTLDLRVPRIMRFPFGKPLHPFTPWNKEHHPYHRLHITQKHELNKPRPNYMWSLVIPVMSVSMGHMILFSSFYLGYFAHLQICACMIIYTHNTHCPL